MSASHGATPSQKLRLLLRLNLKDIVQAIEVDTAGYLNAPPNGWLAATERATFR